MRPVRLEPAAPRSRVKQSTTEPLRSMVISCQSLKCILYSCLMLQLCLKMFYVTVVLQLCILVISCLSLKYIIFFIIFIKMSYITVVFQLLKPGHKLSV